MHKSRWEKNPSSFLFLALMLLLVVDDEWNTKCNLRRQFQSKSLNWNSWKLCVKANLIVSKFSISMCLCNVYIPVQNYKSWSGFFFCVSFLCVARQAWNIFFVFEFGTHTHIHTQRDRETTSSKGDWNSTFCVCWFNCILIFDWNICMMTWGKTHRNRLLFRLFFHSFFFHLQFIHFQCRKYFVQRYFLLPNQPFKCCGKWTRAHSTKKCSILK